MTDGETPAIPRNWLTRFSAWNARTRVARKLAYTVAGLAVLSGVATVSTMTGAGYDLQTILYLLYGDLVLLLLLGGLVGARLVTLWLERRRRHAGAGLHARFVMLFSLIAVTPAVLVAIFAAVFLNVGLQSWFSDRVKQAVEESAVVARAYLHEHQQNIRADILAMANDLNRQAGALMRNPELFNRILSAQANLRGLPEAVVADSSGRVIARSPFSQSLEFDLMPSDTFSKAEDGEIAILTSDRDDRVRAIVRLTRFVDAYLLVGRFVDARVIDHIEQVERARSQYERIEKQRGGIQVTFVMIFIVVAVLMLLAAIWIGLTLATQLAQPIGSLIQAAERVREGRLDVQVNETSPLEEFDTLIRAFNRMTRQLAAQKDGLLNANQLLDERRRFTETVLSGVSAGVIGLDREGCIHLPNRSASELLEIDLGEKAGKPLAEVAPEMAMLFDNVTSRPDRLAQAEITLDRGSRRHVLLVRMAAERDAGGETIGYVVTFDDITELQSAQRKAAWADVARRIAHEIRNPLTPIQLSAERLKRKYIKEIQSDPETFRNCTDTIIRQVNDIGRMVDEFSSFARMPQASMKRENLRDICQEAVFLERNRNSDIEFAMEFPEDGVPMRCDRRQLSRALTNLLKNAAESINARIEKEDAGSDGGRITVRLEREERNGEPAVLLTVEDNGLGLPKAERARLTEPYVTTREKGTGLGLAIVRKIVEDHAGDLELEDAEGRGARVTLVFWPDRIPGPEENGASGNGTGPERMVGAAGDGRA